VIDRDKITLGHPENTDLGSFWPLEVSRGQHKQKMPPSAAPSAKRRVTSAARRRRRAPEAPSAGGAKRRRRQAPEAPSAAGAKRRSMVPGRKLVARAQRGSRALTRRGYVYVRSPAGVYIYVFDHPEG
jgi:hypothetical protein